MSAPKFYYGPEETTGPYFMTNYGDAPEVDTAEEYDELFTAQRIGDLMWMVRRIDAFWKNPDHPTMRGRVLFESLEGLFDYVHECVHDIENQIGLKCDEFDRETGK